MNSFETGRVSFGNIRQLKAKGNKSELPLYYKDKPSRQPKSSKAVMLFKGFIISIVFYALYFYITNDKVGSKTGALTWEERKQEVKDVFLQSWKSYENHAWGKDEYSPIKQTGKNMGPKPLGWMIVDSLDTMMIMDTKEELAKAREWVKNDLDYHFDYEVNVFETTIRMLGGLLSAYHLSNDDMYLDKATDLAYTLIGAFDTPSGLPYSSVNLKTGKGVKSHFELGHSSTAEVATLQLELKYLAKLTGEKLFWEKAEKIMEVLDDNKPEDGLVPIYVSADTGKYQGNLIRLGSRGDSYYEYLLKQYLQTNNQEKVYWDMYRESVEGVKKHLVGKSYPNKLTFIGELEHGIGGALSPKMDHLVCFYGGLLAIGATNGLTYEEAKKLPDWDETKESDFQLGKDLTYTCYKMYHDVQTGLSPEIVVFNQDNTKSSDFYIKPADRHNLQRPETVESLYYLYKVTGDVKYREYGYEIFQNFVKYTKITGEDGEIGYTSLNDVTSNPPKVRDNTESFWFAETLKYLYLLFDDSNIIPLEKYVFNTEAHPFPRFDLTEILTTGWRRKIDPTKEPLVQPPRVAIDKKNPPKAALANKPIDQEVLELVEEHPDAKKDVKNDNMEKLNEIIKDLNSD